MAEYVGQESAELREQRMEDGLRAARQAALDEAANFEISDRDVADVFESLPVARFVSNDTKISTVLRASDFPYSAPVSGMIYPYTPDSWPTPTVPNTSYPITITTATPAKPQARESGGGGAKFDGDKPMMDLIDVEFMTDIAKVLTFGAQKYAPNNWRKGFAYGRLYAALLRHVTSFWAGEETDPESGLPHLAHAACMLMFLSWHAKHRQDLDDRYTEAGTGDHDPSGPARTSDQHSLQER